MRFRIIGPRPRGPVSRMIHTEARTMADQLHVWRLAHGRTVSLDRPRVLAIINVTPDSFYDGGRFDSPDIAVMAAVRAAEHGADMFDIGGESTRPGAARISADEQARRVIPVIRAIRALPGEASTIPISVDTTRADVAAEAIDAGANAINDVSAGREDPAMLDLAARRGAGLILMHRLAPPDEDSYSDRYAKPPRYTDVVADVREFLAERAHAAVGAGSSRQAVALDPGLGFGKTVEQNLELLRRTGEIATLGFPIVSGLSRKSFVGRASAPSRDTHPSERLSGTLSLSVLHLVAGARLFRVHDVGEHVEALGAAWRSMGHA